MKKISILTTTGYENYGNRLQNYALAKILTDLGNTIKTVKIDPKKNFSFSDKVKNGITIKRVFNKFRNLLNSSLKNKKIEKTKEFSRMYSHESSELIRSIEQFKDEMRETDFVVVGSDQVWNPTKVHEEGYFFAPCTKPEQNIAYAPSFGIESIPLALHEQYSNGLKNFAHLSVREEVGKKIIKELIDIDVPILVDPTLLLTKEQWLVIAKKHIARPNKKYVLTYFICQQEKKFYKDLENFSKENSFEFVNLMEYRDKKRYDADPREFLDYYNNAEIIFTDSFHGTIFSIIFEKPFVVYNKNNALFSRIETLLSMFQLEYRNWEYVKINKNYFNIDYNHVPAILESERKKSFDFLKDALMAE